MGYQIKQKETMEINFNNLAEILQELKLRGEHSFNFDRIDDRTIISRHGKKTINYWTIIDGRLLCFHTESESQYSK